MNNVIELSKDYVPALDEVYKESETSSVLNSSPKDIKMGQKDGEFLVAKYTIDGMKDYELLVLQFDNSEPSKFNDNARTMKIDNQEFTIYYSNECPYVEYEVKELSDYAKNNYIKINFIRIDTLEKAKNVPCVFNNWANFYKVEFVSNTLLNANSFEKIIK